LLASSLTYNLSVPSGEFVDAFSLAKPNRVLVYKMLTDSQRDGACKNEVGCVLLIHATRRN
jgi:hypothetical protein